MSDERYSPQFVIDGAHAVMRAIDLDPASSVAANERVGAATFYTREQNGLVLPWFGRLFLNAPYSNYSEWIRKLADEKERVEQVFLLGPIPSLSLIADRCRFCSMDQFSIRMSDLSISMRQPAKWSDRPSVRSWPTTARTNSDSLACSKSTGPSNVPSVSSI